MGQSQAQVIQMPQADHNAATVRKLVEAYESYVSIELPKLVAALYESDGKGGGALTFTASMKWNKNVEIEFQAVGSEKYPPKVLLEGKGEITGKKQLNLF